MIWYAIGAIIGALAAYPLAAIYVRRRRAEARWCRSVATLPDVPMSRGRLLETKGPDMTRPDLTHHLVCRCGRLSMRQIAVVDTRCDACIFRDGLKTEPAGPDDWPREAN